MDKTKIHLSVVIPMYNEVANLERGVLNDVYRYFKKQKYTWELLVVDDASTDESLKYVKKFAKGKKRIKVCSESHKGKGGTVIAGMLVAEGEIILFTDMDQATPIDQVEKLLPKFENFDIVIGSRSGREGAPIVRKLMAFGFSVVRTIILQLPYKDTQCGFKAFKSKASRRIFKRMKVFSEKEVKGAAVNAAFDLEMLYIARKLELKVLEVPVNWHHVGTERVQMVRDSWQAITDLLRVRINAMRGKYKAK